MMHATVAIFSTNAIHLSFRTYVSRKGELGGSLPGREDNVLLDTRSQRAHAATM